MGSHLDTPQWSAFEMKMLRRREERLRRARVRRRRLIAIALIVAAGGAATFAALRFDRLERFVQRETVYASVTAPALSLPERVVAPTAVPAIVEPVPPPASEQDVRLAEFEPLAAEANRAPVNTSRDPFARIIPTTAATSGDISPIPTEIAESTPRPEPADMGTPNLGAPALPADATPVESSPPAPAPPAQPPAVPEPPAFDPAEVRRAIDLYRDAYQRLNADAARAIWPSVDAAALARAFRDLASQRVDFDGCLVSGNSDAAQATCTGRTSFVPKVGGGDPVSTPREWRFRLWRRSGSWVIESAEVK